MQAKEQQQTFQEKLQAFDPGDYILESPEKLYKLPRDTWVCIEDASKVQAEFFFFSHIDGMYSVCYDLQGNLIHLMCATVVSPMRKAG